MSSQEQIISKSQEFQFRLTVEEWITGEFEKVTVKYEGLLDCIDHVRFIGIGGLIQRENKKISPFYFQLKPENGEQYLIIAFSIPIFQSLDSTALQTGMEYFASILKYVLCEKKTVIEAELEAFNDIKHLRSILYNKQEIIPYENFTEKIEAQLNMKIRMGMQIIPVSTIKEKFDTGHYWHSKEIRTAKNVLAAVQSNLKEYSQQISKKYHISVQPYLFQTSLENRFEPIIIPVFFLNSINQAKESFSVFVLTVEVINRATQRQLEILLAHEIIFDLFKEKFSRGILEREIFHILSQDTKDPTDLIEKELSKFFPFKEIKEAQLNIRNIIENMLEEDYPVMKLD
ncbi:MAG: hypothetical protein ACW97X_00765 [Candidatus Hodarchaeales archaeon]|jgi:hypothetical protein